MTHTVEKIVKYSKDLGVYRVCEDILNDDRFPVWSGSSKEGQHHYGEGGLAEHTLEVIDTCFKMRELYENRIVIDPKELFLSALFHDVGKMYDYEPIDELLCYTDSYPDCLNYSQWQSTPHKRNIHHISRSGIMWSENARKDEVIYDKYFEKVLHAILSHHTTREYGSPVAPKSRVAWMLTLCDNMSARMNDCDTWDCIGAK